ncbi:MAG: helix-turn-helix transcriptional regulator [Candidatus Limnocylindrales bacterium]
MAGRVSSAVLVGRRNELGRLQDAVAGAADGHGSLIFLAGEAGVGKSRLVAELVASSREEGLAAVGSCVEMGVAAIPFAPFRQALRELAGALGIERLLELGGARAELTGLLPAAALSPMPRPPVEEPIGLGTDSSQARMFEALLELLRRIGSEQRLLLVVEDIHWADPSTLHLLRYLANGIANASFALVATFRSDELHRRHPLQPFLGEIQRNRSTERIDLDGFSKEEVSEQLAAIIGQPATPELINRVHGRSNGNAFYAEELVAVEQSGAPLPAAMRDVLLARVASVDADTQELLRIVAAGGAQVSTQIVAMVAGSEPAEAEASLREAVDRRLIVPTESDGDERLAFRHALVQEAVYSELLPGERARLHERFGAALASIHQPNDASSAELAYHWYAAHDLPRALTASIEAAVWAEGNHAYADAQRNYERALELWDRVPDAGEQISMDRIDLLECAASATEEGNPPRAAALMLEAIKALDDTVDRVRLGLLKERYGRYAWMAGDGFAAIAACREAVALVPDQPPTRARARVLASLGQILMITMVLEEARRTCLEAVETARLVNATDVEGHALDSLGVTNAYLGDLDTGLGQLRQSLEIAKRLGAIDDIIRAHANIVDVLAHSGHLAAAGSQAEEAYEFTREHGLPPASSVLDLAEGALAYYRLGQCDKALRLLEQAQRLGVGGVPQMMVEQRLALLEVGLGRHEAAAARLASARTSIETAVEAQMIAPLVEAAAQLALWRGRPLEARADVTAATERLEARPAYISRLGPLYALGVRAEADLSAIARAHRDEEALDKSAAFAGGYVQTMQSLSNDAEAGLPNFLTQSTAWLSACEAEMARLRGSSDPALWSRSAASFGAIPMAYPRAYALWRQAEAELAVSHSRASAVEPLKEARQIAVELVAAPLLGEIDALARRAGIDIEDVPDAQPGTSAIDPLGLTPREREILKLLASGRTNRQIAEELFITVGTTGTHVSHILDKLGVRGRTEAADVAHRMGLID